MFSKTRNLTLAMMILAGSMALIGCGSHPDAVAKKDTTSVAPVYVRVASVEHTNAVLPVRAVGRLEAKEELRLSFKIGGIVEKMFVDEGQQVSRGQLLATLSLTEIDAQLAQAQNGFDKADRDLKRIKSLFADTVATLEQLQNATTAWEMAKAGLDAAAFNRKYAQIYAPSDGRILQRKADDHELVSPGTPIIVMTANERGWVVRTSLADRDLVRISLGDAADINFDAIPGVVIPGIISEIGAAPNPANGTYEVEIKISSSASHLMSGLIGKIDIIPSAINSVTTVPIEALASAQGERGFIYALNSDKKTASKIPVTIAYLRDGRAGISEKLTGISSVITAGISDLTDGALVSVVK